MEEEKHLHIYRGVTLHCQPLPLADRRFEAKLVIQDIRDGKDRCSSRWVMREGTTMMREVLLLVTLLAAAQAQADQTCTAAATERKLTGSAKTSFMRKCQVDAKIACDAQSTEKLAGAAMTTLTQKCVKGAVRG